MNHILSSLLLYFIIQVGVFSQTIPFEHSIVVVKQKGKNARDIAHIEAITSDSISYSLFPSQEKISHNLKKIKKIYLNHNVRIFYNSKFHYRNSLLLNASVSAGYNHGNMHLSLNKRFNYAEVGIGVGRFSNFVSLPLSIPGIFVRSTPIYINSKYIFTKGKKAYYTRAKLGYNFNSNNRIDIQNVNNGPLFEPSIGVVFSSKRRLKHYLEVSQHFSYASGSFSTTDFNSSAPVSGTFKIWFNKTLITYGIEIGKSGKR
ncbi:MAG: hypothetical protein N4A35_04890 [Flavobacteriales bacterium]|nr:hypothetical protein [Flavobacteriales bacterium]